MDFKTRISAAIARNNSLVCVGLDADIARLPRKFKSLKEPQFDFNRAIIDATADLVCAYKPNSAFYEALGADGINELKKTINYIHNKYPDIPVILDAKRADIGNTNAGYVSFVFDYLGADAVTIHPYLGKEAIEPFLNCHDKGIIILCRTSNVGSGEFQDLKTAGKKLYEEVAEQVAAEWNYNDNAALVVGATYPQELAKVREIVGDDMLILVPGIGAQGGDVAATVRAGVNSHGDGIMVNSSRDIIFASDKADFVEAARARTLELRDKINRYRYAELILELADIGGVKFGEFTLKSGMKSPIYIDLRTLVSYPATMQKVAAAYARALENLKYDRMAAVPYAAMPIVAAISAQNLVPWIFTRKEVKGYGTNKLIEGEYKKGETVVVVDDMTTNGASKLEVIDPFLRSGLKVTDIQVLLDREQGARELLGAKGYRLHSIITITDVLEVMLAAGRIDKPLYDKVNRFLARNQAT